MKLNYNSMYSFKYKPKGIDTLPIYDAHPMIFILDVNSRYILGLNIHWVPKAYRKEFIEEVSQIISKTKIINKKFQRARLTYILLKKPKYRKALQGLRKYLISNITNLYEIHQRSWPRTFKLKVYNPIYKIGNKVVTKADLNPNEWKLINEKQSCLHIST